MTGNGSSGPPGSRNNYDVPSPRRIRIDLGAKNAFRVSSAGAEAEPADSD